MAVVSSKGAGNAFVQVRDARLENARLLVDAQHWDTGTRRPRGNLAHIVDDSFEGGGILVVLLQFQDDAEVGGDLAQGSNVFLDVLGSVVMIVEDAPDLVCGGVVGDAEADVDGEDELDEVVQEQVQSGVDELAEGLRT